jgi:hypothetical protein
MEKNGLVSPNLYQHAGNNPIIYIDPNGLSPTPSAGLPRTSSAVDINGIISTFGGQRGWIDCFGDCIDDNDPLNLVAKGIFTGLGGTFPRAWITLIGLRATRLGGATTLTTVPSAASQCLGLGAGNALRVAGRIVSPLWVAYGDYMAVVEARCAYVCGENSRSY